MTGTSRARAIAVAVQSHWFQVGATVARAGAGVGAVATQAPSNASLGPRGLAFLKAGRSPAEALQALLEPGEQRDQRRVSDVLRRGEPR